MKIPAAFLIILFTAASSFAAAPVKPAGGDKCPVCGMLVASSPDFLAQVIFSDGSYAVFDGARDMFRYCLDLPRFNPSRKKKDIEAIYVTDYYALQPINGLKAFYVVGSNVNGPTGKELIPFEKKEEAQGFLTEHAGRKILRFEDITPEVVKSLETAPGARDIEANGSDPAPGW